MEKPSWKSNTKTHDTLKMHVRNTFADWDPVQIQVIALYWKIAGFLFWRALFRVLLVFRGTPCQGLGLGMHCVRVRGLQLCFCLCLCACKARGVDQLSFLCFSLYRKYCVFLFYHFKDADVGGTCNAPMALPWKITAWVSIVGCEYIK